MRVRGRRVSPLLLGLFVSLSIVALTAVAPVQAKGGGNGGGGGASTYSWSTYSCAVSVSVSSGNFYVQTTVNAATGSSLPGPSETDTVNAYQNGILYMTQSATYKVSAGTATITVTIPVPTNGAGAYSFQSTILNSKGSQLTSCSGTYSL